MLSSMFKKVLSQKLLLVGAALIPAIGQAACDQSNVTTHPLRQNYSGVTALPVARYLGLDATCAGRQLNSVTLHISSSNQGLATLIVNGIPTGPSVEIGADVGSYEFLLNADANTIGVNIRDIEIRLGGDFHLEGLEGSLSDAPATRPVQNPFGTLIGQTAAVSGPAQVVTFALTPGVAYTEITVVAKDAAYSLQKLTLNFQDGGHASYGPAVVEKDAAARASVSRANNDSGVVSVEVTGTAADLDAASLEIWAK